ncbi:MAG: hypothetical protein HKN39_02405 [Flavobacteriales bacterium]|nr:hypothetical protein [Flavobacteriales bacterium]
MEYLNAKKFAIGAGLTSAIIYIGCYLTMAVLGEKALVKFANLLFHGVEFESILRPDIPVLETLIGIVVSFVFWGLVGFILANIYNKIKSSNIKSNQ